MRENTRRKQQRQAAHLRKKSYADRPQNNDDFNFVIGHYQRMGLLRRYDDWVSLPAVAQFIRKPDETLDAAYARVVQGITSAELHHVMTGEVGPDTSDDPEESEMPFTRWEWVDEWTVANS